MKKLVASIGLLGLVLGFGLNAQAFANGDFLDGYNAVVKDAADLTTYTNECAAHVSEIAGVEDVEALTAIGIITFYATEKASRTVAQLKCVMSVELNQVMEPRPSTRVGNN